MSPPCLVQPCLAENPWAGGAGMRALISHCRERHLALVPHQASCARKERSVGGPLPGSGQLVDGAPHPAPVLIGSRHGDSIPTRPPPRGQEAVTSIQLCLGLGARLVPGIMSQVPLPSHPTAPHALHRLLSLRNLRFPLPVGPSAAPQLTSEGPGVTSSDSSAHTRLPGPRRCASSPLWVSASGHVLRAAFPVPVSPLCHLPGVTTLSSRCHVHIQSASPLDCPPMRTGRLSRPLQALTRDQGGRGTHGGSCPHGAAQ